MSYASALGGVGHLVSAPDAPLGVLDLVAAASMVTTESWTNARRTESVSTAGSRLHPGACPYL